MYCMHECRQKGKNSDGHWKTDKTTQCAVNSKAEDLTNRNTLGTDQDDALLSTSTPPLPDVVAFESSAFLSDLSASSLMSKPCFSRNELISFPFASSCVDSVCTSLPICNNTWYNVMSHPISWRQIILLLATCSWLVRSAGRTSFTVRSTRTPPTSRKHFRSESTSFRASITKLQYNILIIYRGKFQNPGLPCIM